jgi:hypothetical protein
MCHTLRKGTRSKLLLVYARDPRDGRSGRWGLRYDSPGASAGYVREGEPHARTITLAPATPGEYRAGGFVEVDPQLMPAVYQFGVPDEALAEGADSAILMLRFAGALIDPVKIDLVAYDPQDGDRLGMTAIGREGRIAALRGAFPRVTARELLEP